MRTNFIVDTSRISTNNLCCNTFSRRWFRTHGCTKTTIKLYIEMTKPKKHAVYKVLAQLKCLLHQEYRWFITMHSIQLPERSSAEWIDHSVTGHRYYQDIISRSRTISCTIGLQGNANTVMLNFVKVVMLVSALITDLKCFILHGI